MAPRLGILCSILLSYGDAYLNHAKDSASAQSLAGFVCAGVEGALAVIGGFVLSYLVPERTVLG